MAIDSNGKHYEYRTLQFYGFAYGDSNVSLTATINGNIVFTGEVSTTNSSLPIPPVDDTNAAPLFSLPDSQLFPTNLCGSYPMSIAVSGGHGIVLTAIYSNYTDRVLMSERDASWLANCSIEGTTLTIGSVLSGNVSIGQFMRTEDKKTWFSTPTIITGGSGLTWTVYPSQTVSSTLVSTNARRHLSIGTATDFKKMEMFRLPALSIPLNHQDITILTDVVIDGVAQPIPAPQTQYGSLIVPTDSTITYNLNFEEIIPNDDNLI